MRRRLFNIASVMSLVLCVATVALWVRSYWQSYSLYYDSRVHDGRAWGGRVRAPRGLLIVQTYRDVVRRGQELEYQRGKGAEPGWRLEGNEAVAYASPLYLIRGLWTFYLSFDSSTNGPSDPEMSSKSTTAISPLWVLVLIFAAPIGFWSYRRLRSRRRLPGNCSACGYDLAGNTSGVCPECGTVVAGKAEGGE